MTPTATVDLLFDPERHTYWIGHKKVLSVTQLIHIAGCGEDWSAVPKDVMERAQVRGRMVHRACQFLDEGGLDWSSVDPALEGYVRAYAKFQKEGRIIPVVVEQKMGSAVLGFAGTPDLICWMGGRRVVVDRKTGNPGTAARLQTAGYAMLRNYLFPKAPVYERYSLRLHPDGRYFLYPHENNLDGLAFDAIRRDPLHLPEWVRRTYGRSPVP